MKEMKVEQYIPLTIPKRKIYIKYSFNNFRNTKNNITKEIL